MERSSAQRSRTNRARPGIEHLEGRQLLSDMTPRIALIAASTPDSQGVTLTYEVENGDLDQSIPFLITRSADDQADATDIPVATAVIATGDPEALTEGTHTVTFGLPDGLKINPQHPFVLVTADPNKTTGDAVDPDHATTGFRKATVAVITHGGMQSKGVSRGPWWQRRMTAELQSQGYDLVVPFNWVDASRSPGSMVRQVPRLTTTLYNAFASFPADEPVDLHMIGHSEGAILNSLALKHIADTNTTPPQMQAGHVKVTMLDPHSASTGIQGQQYSTSNGLFGKIAKSLINQYQSRSDDPPPFVPSNADEAEVFFQRTHVKDAEAGNHGWYNLWGQVPVVGDATYYDLTGHGISHSGKFAVYDWYQVNVVPTLGTGSTFIDAGALSGKLVTPPSPGRTTEGFVHVDTRKLTFAGQAAPGAVVKIFGARPGVEAVDPIARTTAASDGSWQATTRNLYSGMIRTVATSTVPHDRGTRPHYVRPTAWFTNVVIDRIRPQRRSREG